MLGLSFLFPAILMAAAAAAVPVIIHLTMRTRPRTVVFPTMRFVRKIHEATLSKLRLKHVLLLLLRMAAIVLIAILIARPQVAGWGRSDDGASPMGVVFVVDNSGSMNARRGGRTVLARARSFATKLLESLPVGSRAAVVTTSQPGSSSGLLRDRQLVAQQIADVRPGFADASVRAGLDRAGTLLAECDLPRKKVYLLTDLTRHAFRDDADLGGGIDLAVLDCCGAAVGNVSLGAIRINNSATPIGVDFPIRIAVRSEELGGEFAVVAELDGKARMQKTVRLDSRGSATVELTVRPERLGLVHGRVTVQVNDAMEMDDVRYFTLRVGQAPEAIIVRDARVTGSSQTAFLLANAIGPPGLKRQWVRRRTVDVTAFDKTPLGEAGIVLLAEVSQFSQSQWTRLERFVRSGGRLWVVAGPQIDPESYNGPAARRVLPVGLGLCESPAEEIAWRTPPNPAPMLSPFTVESNGSLEEIACLHRFEISSLSENASVLLRYEDNVPAIVSRRVGQGVCVFWNFSPRRACSNLASRVQFPVLAQQTARVLAWSAKGETMHTWGELVSVAFPKGMAGAEVGVRKGDSIIEEPVFVGGRQGGAAILADRLGPWTVLFRKDQRQVAEGFSVNAAVAESDLSRMGSLEFAAMVAPQKVPLADSVEKLALAEQVANRPSDLVGPLLLALLVLLTVESLFANRFYRRSGDSDGQASFAGLEGDLPLTATADADTVSEQHSAKETVHGPDRPLPS